MRFLILDHYYSAFLKAHYDQHPGLKSAPYDTQITSLLEACFGTADFYSKNLRALGHEAEEVITNSRALQRAWAKEQAPQLLRRSRIADKAWEMKVVEQQVMHHRPDVLHVQHLNYFDSDFISHLGTMVPLIIGQCAYPVDESFDYKCYDLILTSLPHFVRYFERRGVASAYLRLAFEPSILERLAPEPVSRHVVFVGGISSSHAKALSLLEKAANELPIEFFGYGADQLAVDSAIRIQHRGEAWGLEMYRQLARSRISLNRHIDVSGRFANNMRLYETTGVGTCLVTDMKDNLSDLFIPDEEVVAYRSPEECVEKITYLLSQDQERARIAQAGQKRTLSEHTYLHRMGEMIDLIRQTPSPRRRKNMKVRKWEPAKYSTESLKQVVRRSPLAPLARRLYQLKKPRQDKAISAAYTLLEESEVSGDLLQGWKRASIPARQRQVVDHELRRMYRDDVVPIFSAAQRAIDATGLVEPTVLDIGCASGYYGEVLNHLIPDGVKYIGADYSSPLVRQAAELYPAVQFLVADATAIPLVGGCIDIVFSSAAIMHIADYSTAIMEIFRTSSAWCIFHRTPVLEMSRTTYLSKEAYGVPVMELVFNEDELIEWFTKAGGEVTEVLGIDLYSLPGLNEPIQLKTYVCRKV